MLKSLTATEQSMSKHIDDAITICRLVTLIDQPNFKIYIVNTEVYVAWIKGHVDYYLNFSGNILNNAL